MNKFTYKIIIFTVFLSLSLYSKEPLAQANDFSSKNKTNSYKSRRYGTHRVFVPDPRQKPSRPATPPVTSRQPAVPVKKPQRAAAPIKKSQQSNLNFNAPQPKTNSTPKRQLPSAIKHLPIKTYTDINEYDKIVKSKYGWKKTEELPRGMTHPVTGEVVTFDAWGKQIKAHEGTHALLMQNGYAWKADGILKGQQTLTQIGELVYQTGDRQAIKAYNNLLRYYTYSYLPPEVVKQLGIPQGLEKKSLSQFLGNPNNPISATASFLVFQETFAQVETQLLFPKYDYKPNRVLSYEERQHFQHLTNPQNSFKTPDAIVGRFISDTLANHREVQAVFSRVYNEIGLPLDRQLLDHFKQ